MTRYQRALEATEEHLRVLQADGSRFVNIRAETLFDLQQPVAAVVEKTGESVRETVETLMTSSPLPSPPSVSAGAGALGGSGVQATRVDSESSRREDATVLDPAPTGTGVNIGGVFPNAATGLEVAAARPGVLVGAEREAAMAALRERALACVKCPHLVKTRQNVVFGVGDIHARLMFVGEAPGADEDAQGEPFVGAAGQLLTKIIKAMGLSRETVYIANVLKCRPDTPGQSYGNRKPTADEMKTCLPWLKEQIDLMRPEVMVALGGTAVEGLLGKTEGITRLRGHFQTFQGIPIMPTFHPSYLLRNQAVTEKRKVWEDMMQVMDKLGMPINEKQRGYFLKP